MHSYHIPIKNLGISEDSNNKTIVDVLNDPRKITRDKPTKELMEDIHRKFHDVISERKAHFFRTERFKKKKEFKTGTQMKGF